MLGCVCICSATSPPCTCTRGTSAARWTSRSRPWRCASRRSSQLERRVPLGDIGAAAAALGDGELARRCLEESLAIARQVSDRTQEILCLGHLGWLEVQEGQTGCGGRAPGRCPGAGRRDRLPRRSRAGCTRGWPRRTAWQEIRPRPSPTRSERWPWPLKRAAPTIKSYPRKHWQKLAIEGPPRREFVETDMIDCCSKVDSSSLFEGDPVRMERSASVQQEYASFLIRMWREVDPAAPDIGTQWHGEIEHIQSGRRSSFSTLAGLLDCLQAQILAGGSAAENIR